MLKLIKGQENRFTLSVTSSIDVTGFSVKLMFVSPAKTIQIQGKPFSTIVSLTAEEVASIQYDRTYGKVVVLDGDGNEYLSMLVEIQKYPDTTVSLPRQFLPVVVVANNVGLLDKGSGYTGDQVMKSDFAGISNPDKTINGNNATLISILSALKGEN